MEPGDVRRAAQQLSELASQMEADCSSLLNQVSGIDWLGPSRDDFVGQSDSLLRRFLAASQEAAQLSQRIGREVDEWERVDSRGAQTFESFMGIGLIPVAIDDIGDLVTDMIRRRRYKDYQDWWKGLGRDEKLDYLNKHSEEIAKKYGFRPMKIVVEDLDDKGGDARGLNRGNELVIDVDNLDHDDPWRSVETVAHESRHEYQEQVIKDYRESGKLPEGVTEKQVKDWESSSGENYKPAQDDFESYWHQSIEADARDFGNDYMNEVLDSQDWKPSGAA
jgi:hypothetical protein